MTSKCAAVAYQYLPSSNTKNFRARTSADSAPSEGTTAAQTVYVIDDDASVRRSLERLLTSSNWPVRTFDSAEAFLEELDKLSSGCLIVDIQLQGMSGLELIRRLTDARLSWPIIVMSALHESEALRLGARAYLRKPFDAQALFDAIAGAMLS